MPSLMSELQILLCFIYVTNVILAVLLALSGRNFRGAWLWVLAQAFLTIGTIADASVPLMPDWMSSVVANLAYSISSIFFCHSVWVFRFKQSFFKWVYAVIALQFLSLLLAYPHSYSVQTSVFSAWMVLGPGLVALLLLWKVERRFWLSNSLTALPFLLLSSASLLRLIYVLSVPDMQSAQKFDSVNAWYVSGAILLSTITLFGYYMMTGIRSMQVLSQKDQEIEARNQKLLEAGRSKDLFFAIVSHDLRGPISGAARYVRKNLVVKLSGLHTNLPELEILASSLERTNDFLEKLLWWAKSQLQDWQPKQDAIDLQEIVTQVIAMHSDAAQQKGLKLEMDPVGEFRVLADAESVQLILSNFLSNAIKFSTHGSQIWLRLSSEDALCQISVEDSGIGMDQETLDRLFHIEDKLSTIGTSRELGSGMGLILAQSLAHRNNAKILLCSQKGQGTSASLVLTLAK